MGGIVDEFEVLLSEKIFSNESMRVPIPNGWWGGGLGFIRLVLQGKSADSVGCCC